MQHPIMRALASIGLSTRDAALAVGVDPKTIQRWCDGRVPYRTNRAALARLTGWPEHDLWPDVVPIPDAEVHGVGAELAYANVSVISCAEWRSFFAQAEECIDILHWASLIEEGVQLARICREAGPKINPRLLLVDVKPEDADTLLSGVYVDLCCRISIFPEYSAIYRADNDLLVSPQIFGCPPGRWPVLKLHLHHNQEIASAYMEIFQRSWERAF